MTIFSPDIRQARFQFVCEMVAKMFTSLTVEEVRQNTYHTTLCYLSEFSNADPSVKWNTKDDNTGIRANQVVLDKSDAFVVTGIAMGARRIFDNNELIEPMLFAPDKRYHNGVTSGGVTEWGSLEAMYGGRIRMEQASGEKILIKEHPAYRLRFDGTSQYAPSTTSPTLNEQHGEYDFDRFIDRLYKSPIMYGDKDYTATCRFAANTVYSNIRGTVDAAGVARPNNGRLIGGFFLDGFVIPGLATAKLATV
jgi:hypothetical protein